MTTRFDSDSNGRDGTTVAAVYATERDARAAITSAHRAGFRETWLGKTREPNAATGEPTIEPDDMIARFLSVGMDRRPLHAALIHHGLTEDQARRIEADIAPGSYVVTAYGEDNPLFLAELLANESGRIFDAFGAVRAGVGDQRAVVIQRDEFEAGELRANGTSPRDADGYEIEEFIATRRSGEP